MNNTITLNPAEQKLAQYLAKVRHSRNRREGVKDRQVGPQSSAQTDLDGIAGEIVVAKLLNVYPDLAVDHRPDHDLSVTLWNGLTVGVDVKTTRYKNGKLLAVPSKSLKVADAYALVVGEFPAYRVAGFALGEALVHESRLIDLGHGPTYGLPQSALLPWADILRYFSDMPYV